VLLVRVKQGLGRRRSGTTCRQARARAAQGLERAAAGSGFIALGCRGRGRASTSAWTSKARSTSSKCNPLPGLTPGWSRLVLIGQGGGHRLRRADPEILSGADPPLQGSGSGAADRVAVRWTSRSPSTGMVRRRFRRAPAPEAVAESESDPVGCVWSRSIPSGIRDGVRRKSG